MHFLRYNYSCFDFCMHHVDSSLEVISFYSLVLSKVIVNGLGVLCFKYFLIMYL
jgi:hypothetical protein